MKNLSSLAIAVIVLAFCAVTAMPSPAQTFTMLLAFDGTDGSGPGLGSLVQGANGNLYGTTGGGGTAAKEAGTVFKITPDGELTTLYSFCSLANCADGGYPEYGLVLASNGNFYGTTSYGGPNGYGTIFEITPAGALTTLHSFGDAGARPTQLIQAANGNFYGMTSGGGTYSGGTVFVITPAGKFTTLYNFCSQPNCTDGEEPISGLVQVRNGNFYGTTDEGGTNGYGYGTVFEITAAGRFKSLHSFCSLQDCLDGSYPTSILIQATDGYLYGTTNGGGSNCIYLGGCGTIFKISTAGELSTFYNFCSEASCNDGWEPEAGLIQAANGNFFGTTSSGGPDAYGNVYGISPEGKLNTLHVFNYVEGYNPLAGVIQTNNGDLYGTTLQGGSSGIGTLGTVYSISLGHDSNQR